MSRGEVATHPNALRAWPSLVGRAGSTKRSASTHALASHSTRSPVFSASPAPSRRPTWSGPRSCCSGSPTPHFAPGQHAARMAGGVSAWTPTATSGICRRCRGTSRSLGPAPASGRSNVSQAAKPALLCASAATVAATPLSLGSLSVVFGRPLTTVCHAFDRPLQFLREHGGPAIHVQLQLHRRLPFRGLHRSVPPHPVSQS